MALQGFRGVTRAPPGTHGRLGSQGDPRAASDWFAEALNRKGLFEAIIPLSHLAKRNGYKVGLIMVDIDNFKSINDTYGHLKGDEVLRSIASILKSHLRISDKIGRYGGDEFLLFFPQVNPDHLQKISERIRNDVEKVGADRILMTISIGGASGSIAADVEEGLNSLIAKAGICLLFAQRMVSWAFGALASMTNNPGSLPVGI